MASLPSIEPAVFKQTLTSLKEESAIIQAADSGDIKTLEELVTTANVNTPASNGLPPVFFAAAGNHKEAVALLKSRGAELDTPLRGVSCGIISKYLNSQGKDVYFTEGATPLLMASESGRLETFIYLIEEGKADSQRTDSWGSTLLHRAAEEGELEIARCLLETVAKTDAERKVLLEKRTTSGDTPFLCARKLPMIRYFIETMRVDVFQADNTGSTILHHLSLMEEGVEVLKYFHETCPYTKGMSQELLEKRDKEGNTPILTLIDGMECSEGFELIRYFVDLIKVDVHQTNIKGETLLHLASAGSESKDVVEYMTSEYPKTEIERTTLLNNRDKLGNTPFLATAEVFSIYNTMVYYVEKLKVDITQSNSARKTILHLIAENLKTYAGNRNRDKGAVEETVEECINKINYFLKTYPQTKEQEENLKVLLEKQDQAGNPPFLDAVQKGCFALVQCYLRSGKVSVNQKNAKGQTALHLACQHNYDRIAKYLIEEGAKTEAERNALIGEREAGGQTAFARAGMHGSMKILCYFMETLQVKIDKNGLIFQAIFRNCAYNGHSLATKYLLSKGARLPSTHKTYTEYAANSERKHSAEFLTVLAAADNLMALANGSLTTPPLAQLLKEGASLTQRFGEKGMTPLHCVATNGDATLLENFLAAGADITARDDAGKTPARYAEEKNHMGIVARLLFQEVKLPLLKKGQNKEAPSKMEVEKIHIEKVEQIFKAAEKIEDPNKKASLYLSLGKQFKELQLIPEAMRAFGKIPETELTHFRAAQAELMDLPDDPNPQPLSLDVEEASDQKKVQEESMQRRMRLLRHLELGYRAGLEPASMQPKDTSALRTQFINDFFDLPTAVPKPGIAVAMPYSDPCTPDGLLDLTTRHALVLENYKKEKEEGDALRVELEKVKNNNAILVCLNRTLAVVIDQTRAHSHKRKPQEGSEAEKPEGNNQGSAPKKQKITK